ncbi:hypothetical protein AC578_7568 [Pseudocercospora eumusae]|uniref:Alpha/beta hydrolase fold-3 domain-containing protein n=1 Tax=Pseudocercospora eumusae TaxID=321146 RepID=A0A139HRU6_9PEZI|nr:hypothetical protein AC578_7568 [Pseudocercospora eumusae]
MPFNTFTVASAVTPSVIETYFSHYLNRKPLKQKPTAHISYHEGLRLIRQFLDYSSKHSIEDLQAFTAQWVPVPTWVRTQDVEIPPQFLTRSANVLRKQLGSHGLEKVGGEKWWQWRRPESPLHAEWIEMKKDHNERKRAGTKCDRVILYVHGGAYYFGSVDEHRYQMQRHARKLKARVLAPRYRLAPQFPFPCGLHDCIAAYFYLLEHFEPNQVLVAGDSAGGGMVLAMLVTLRDQGCPLPAGTILLSPWVDLTHSFPSTSGDGVGDYIPPHGFHHKPSMAWPPPPVSDEEPKKAERKFTQPVEQPFDVVELPADTETMSVTAKPSRDNLRDLAKEDRKKAEPIPAIPGSSHRLELAIDNKLVIIREQIQMYATNDLLTHPLVSAVQQPSLGGLPPMLIQVGGAELLRDEQIYLAHKAANPTAYPPSDVILDAYDADRTVLNLYPPTDVQLQVWEDLCHVPHTLSFTRPAKYMYRSVAQFGAWALARAQHKSIEILDDDAVSVISEGEDTDEFKEENGNSASFGSIGDEGVTSTQFKLTPMGAVGKAGDELPPFKDHMIRQRVNRHGTIFPLPRKSDIKCLHLDPNTIGAIKPGPVRKWLAKRAEHEQKFASEYKKIVKKKIKEQKDWDKIEPGENPPPTALINRRKAGVAPEQKKRGKSWGLAMWSGWGSSHDESTINREERVVEEREKAENGEDEANDVLVAAGLVRADSSMRTPRSQSLAGSNRAASPATLAVPGHEMDAETKNGRRRSSASLLSTPWSRKDREEPARPRTSYRQVQDAGQASSVDRYSAVSPISPQGGDSPVVGGRRGFFDSSRRSSTASGKLTSGARPVSIAGAVPPASEIPPSPTVIAPDADHGSTAPTMSEASTGRETVKVPGSNNTFLNAANSRPHNGVVAYPFKLQTHGKSAAAHNRSPSPNASTMTLESVDGSDGASTRSAESSRLKAARIFGVSPVELPSDLPGTAGAGVTHGAMQHPGSTPSPEEHRPGYETDMIPTLEVSPATFHETGNVQRGNSSSTSSRPVSMLPENARVSHLKSPEHDLVTPVRPLSPSEQQDPIATTTTKHRQGKVEYRDSRLGQLGADGMPTQAFPETSSAPRPTPFKIRNPVYDKRASADVTGQTVEDPSQPVEAPKPAPFKMRHVVYDPRVAPLVSKPPASEAAAAASVAANGTSKSETSPSSDAQALPGRAVTSPTANAAAVVAAQHAAARSVSTNSTASPVDDEKEVVNFSHNNANRDPPQTNNATQLTTIITSRPAPLRPSSSGPPPTPPPKDSPKFEKEASSTLPAKNLAQGRSRDDLKGSDGNTSGPDDITSTKRKPVAVPTSKFSRSNENLGSYNSTPSLPAGAAAGLAGAKLKSANAEISRSPDGAYENQAVAAASAAGNKSGIRPESGVLPFSKFPPAAAAAAASSKEKLKIAPPALPPVPSIGNLSFERSPIIGDFGSGSMTADTTSNNTSSTRPPLETFVTAQEALDLGMKEGQKF